MRNYCWLVIVGAMVATTVAPARGQAGSANFVVIGCLERTAKDMYTITDYRDNSKYRVDASTDQLDWRVGYQLEIHGALVGGTTLKAEKVLSISTTCPAPPGK